MHVSSTLQDLRLTLPKLRAVGTTLGVVPTMGALHEGHMSLIEYAVNRCDSVVVSIFVNPTQFGPGEDYRDYPRELDRDLAKCRSARVELVYTPNISDMYPAGARASITPPPVAEPLEGLCRPGHFAGVCTVVHELFRQIKPDLAFFGQKDAQQTAVIAALIETRRLPIQLVICPTVRTEDGLALSSRNAYLSPSERMQATCLARALALGRQLVMDGERRRATIERAMVELIQQAAPARIDYAAVVSPTTYLSLDPSEPPLMLAVAVHLGQTRLIDNCLVGQHP